MKFLWKLRDAEMFFTSRPLINQSPEFPISTNSWTRAISKKSPITSLAHHVMVIGQRTWKNFIPYRWYVGIGDTIT